MEFKSYLNLKGIVVIVLFLFLGFVSGFAQRTVTGTISGTDGPIIGASIVVKGTTTGTVTDENGNFSLTTKESNPTLIVSALSYSTQQIVVDGTTSAYNVSMLEDISQLNEVVVSGYYNETKRQTTGSVSTVKSKDLTAVATSNVEQQLQGKVAGVTVITSGQPGSSSIIRVRGFGSFGGNTPLFVVDGVATGNVDFLNPDDIESTTVLKDAGAASIYGVRSAPGVIVFTTKHAKKSERKLSVSYDAIFGVTSPGTAPGILNPQEQADWTFIAQKNAGQVPSHPQYGSGATAVLPDYINVGGRSGVIGTIDLAAEKLKYNVDPAAGAAYQVVKANKAGTDWYGAVTRNAPIMRQNLGFSGATDYSRYYIGLGMQNQAGILLNNDFSRYNARINTEFDIFKGFRIGENLQLTYLNASGQTGGSGGIGAAGEENDILSAFRMPSIIPIYDEFGGWAGTAAKGFNNPRNPVAARDGLKNNSQYSISTFGNVYAELDILSGLTLRTSLGGRHYDFAYNGTSRLSYENSENNSSFGVFEGAGHGTDWTVTNTANYKKTFGVHAFDVLVGQEAITTNISRSIAGNGINPFSTDNVYVTLNTVSSVGKTVGSNLSTPYTFSSFFGRINYSFNDKYYLTALVRRDGSSVFGPDTRYGIFPAFSAAWRVTGEDFAKNSSWLSDLKIRGGWGRMGNINNTSPTNQYSLYAQSVGNSSYDINGSKTSAAGGFYRNAIGNPNGKWETATTTNIGFDASLFKNKLEVIFDLWQKQTDDLLFQVGIPDVVGSYANAPSVNIASMLNKGVDIQIINRGNIAKDWSYEANLTAGLLENTITKEAPPQTYFDAGGTRNGNAIRNAVGQGLSTFFGYQVQSLFQTQAEVDAAPKQDGKGVGRFRYADVNGDGVIDDKDRTFIGSPIPKFTGGLNLKLTFKDVSIETYLYTSLGNKIYNFSKWFTDFYATFPGAAISSRVKTDTWTPTNTGATTPIFENVANNSTSGVANSFYVEDGSYLRMTNISLSYQLPQTMIKGILKRAKIYASVNNIFTITKYKGLDPGVGGAADTNFGIDIGNYPVTRSYTFGVSVGF